MIINNDRKEMDTETATAGHHAFAMEDDKPHKIQLSARSVSAGDVSSEMVRFGTTAVLPVWKSLKFRLMSVFSPLPPVKCGGERSVVYYMFKCLFLKYCSKKGRASRKELWSFALLTTLLQLLVFYLFFVCTEDYLRLVWWLNFISAATLLPSVMLIIRRVHDFNKSGWWLFVPTYKIILFAFIKGDDGANDFGAPE